MSFTWNSQQSQARDAILQFVGRGASANEDFVMAGLAGTGKTTLVCDILDELKTAGRRVALIAPTGKAASVLNSKQKSYRASTIHSLLYKRPNDAMSHLIEQIEDKSASLDYAVAHKADDMAKVLRDEIEVLQSKLEGISRSGSKLTFIPRDPEEVSCQYDCIFVDEGSMVGPDLIADIQRLQLPVVYLGDPNQLYPVNQKKFAVRLDTPDVKLTDIMRQGEGSPVLELSRSILTARGLPARLPRGVHSSRGSNPIPFLNMFPDDVQFICYMNNTRRSVNKILRDKLIGSKRDTEFSFLPVEGEKLLIDANEPDKGIMKGDVVTCERLLYYKPDGKRDNYIAVIECSNRLGVKQKLSIHVNDLMLTEGHHWGNDEGRGSKSAEYRYCAGATYDATKVMFSYAITCHKAQGSEWKNIVLYNDPHPESRVQYLYTGVTRAREGLALAQVGY